jgi:UDP-glucose 4-epimerase|tara:strand:- start:678 stop:1610 length:933 start_codon:yes stop_codon:yes gene_type:complete
MKKLLIVGGSGTIARAFLNEYYDYYDFHCIARNERHLAEIKRDFPMVDIYTGNIENKTQLFYQFDKIKPDIVVHMAAMKHVNLVEENPIQGAIINVQGSLNVIEACIRTDVPVTVGLSTDKACAPENVYGYTKSILESCFLESNSDRNKFACTRFANVALTSDSVIPLWKTLIKEDKPLKLTDIKMNRLMFSQKEAVSVIKKTIDICERDTGGFIASTLMKSVNMKDLAETLLEMHDKPKSNIQVVGIRPGEKLDEKLVSQKECPYTYLEDDLILIRQKENKGKNKLETEYSTLTADVMTRLEIEKLCTK